jgi:hypothetical protein
MVVLEPSFTELRPSTIVLPHSKPRSTKGKMLEINLGLEMKDRGMTLENVYKEETPHNLAPKSIKIDGRKGT